MPIVAGATFSHYRFIEPIGEGGVGVVWRARDTDLDRDVAIKVLSERLHSDPEKLAGLEREARAVAALSHPNIVTIHAIEHEGAHRFIAMELVHGRSLAELIPEGGLPLERALEWAVPLADAVAAAHLRGVVHGDIKPGNVMVGEDGRPKILDFGLARINRREEPARSPDATTRTAPPLGPSGAGGGTIPYMAPERILGGEPDRPADLFALGAVIYEMLSGRRPFGGRTAAEAMAAVLRDAPEPLVAGRPDVPRHLERLVLRCLDRDPSRRPGSAAEIRDQLRVAARRGREPGQGGRPSIAVLPFADMSPEQDQDWFCEGIAEEIITALTRVEGLRVASRASSFQFKGAALDSRETADRIGVGCLLDGSVRTSGDRLRITVELVDADDGCRLWSERFDRSRSDVFAIQDEIAGNVVRVLRVTLSPRERRAIKQVATENVRAFEYYLRGRKYYHEYRRRGIGFALQMFRRAIDVDPSYAQAWAGVADCCVYLYMNAEHSEANLIQALEASGRALELDADSAEASASRGAALSIAGRHAEASVAFERALELNPRSYEANYYHARDCFTQGHAEDAVRLYERAADLRPEDYQSLLLVAQIYDDLGRNDEAADARRRGLQRIEQRLDLNPDDTRALYMGANGLVALGDRERGLALAARAYEIEPDEPMLLYNVACVLALAGELEPAIERLERAVDRGFAHLPWIRSDSNLDPLREQPRFAELVARLGGVAAS